MSTARTGILLALISALFFGISGPLAKALYEIGWSPAAAVTFRIGGVALLLTIPTLVSMRGSWHRLSRHWGTLLVYGVMSICGVQLFYFAAVDRVSVAVALLIEYTAPMLVVLFLWIGGRRPGGLTLAGVGVAMLGLVFVLDLRGGLTLDPLGLALALAAALCLASYFIIGARTSIDIPQVAMIGIGMWLGLGAVALVAFTGLLPARFGATAADLGGLTTPWWVPAGLLVVTTVLAYLTGLAAMRALGATMGSFIGLSEVIFAVVLSWLLLGEAPTPVQGIGGIAILLGVVVIKVDEARARRREVVEIVDSGAREPRAREQRPELSG